jgi:hypothetical protein
MSMTVTSPVVHGATATSVGPVGTLWPFLVRVVVAFSVMLVSTVLMS